MKRWYDRIGNTIEMNIGGKWIKGIVINGERTNDGIINMETLDGKRYWCGVGMEHIGFRKCDDSDGNLITNADYIRSLSDEELADMFHNVGSYVNDGEPLIDIWIGEKATTLDDSLGDILEWLKAEREG